ncbi:xanthine dehydrogenase family protein molybdopterin-binding subunit [soil metagenome]
MTASPAIGQPTKRLEGAAKVTGATRYVDDLTFPGMLQARTVNSVYAHAEIVSIDTSAALAHPGVVAVYTGKDVIPDGDEPADRHHAMLARDKAIYYGQAVAVVVATNEAAAEEGAELVQVEYNELGANVDPIAAMQPDAPVIRKKAKGEEWSEGEAHASVSGGEDMDISKMPDNITNATRFTRGNVETGFSEADAVVERQYRSGMVHQGYIEPHATIAVPDPFGNLVIYTMTQGQFYTRNSTAAVLGLPQSQIKVVNLEIGGGFGSKAVLLEPLTGWLALKLNAPVKILMSRTEEFMAGTPAPGSVIDIKIGAKKDGTITAVKAQVVYDSGCYPASPLTVGALIMGSYYQTDNLEITGYEVITNKPGTGAYRAPGAPQATFAIEQAIDEVATEIGWDPVDFRLHNASEGGDVMANDQPWARIGLKEILQTIKDHPLWKERGKDPKKGIGMAIGGWPGGVEPCAANIRVNTDGSLLLTLGHSDITGTNTTFAMLAADVFGTEIDKIKVVNGDTDNAPYAGMAGGSKTTFTLGPAVMKAAEEARKQILAIASAEMEASADDLEMVDGVVRVKGTDQEIAVAELSRLSMSFGGKYEPVYGIGKSAIQDRAPGFSGQIAELTVDHETGQITIDRWVTVQDVGKSLNPAAVEGQMIGGTAQGIGFGLHEQMSYSEDGQLISATMMDYNLPKSNQVPSIETIVLEVPSSAGPMGAKGVGEPPIVPGAAAIANAVANATGKRITEMPLNAERVSKVLMNGK